MSEWNSLNLSRLLPQEIRSASSGVNTVVESAVSFLTLVRTGLQLAQVTAEQAASNPVEAAISSALDELESTLDGLLTNTTAHAILIPVQKQPLGKGVRLPSDSVPDTDRTKTVEALEESGAFGNLRAALPDETITFINGASASVGGNQGFWKTYMQSLNDEGDYNRPIFPSNYAVTGACIVAGADSMKELQRVLEFLSSLIKVNYRSDPGARTRPTIKELSIRTIPDTTSDPPKIGVQLSWPSVPPLKNLAQFGNERLRIKEIFVIRSTDPKFRERFSWSDTFSRQPSEDSNDLQEEGNTKVVTRITNDGFVKQYVDTDSRLELNTSYYYALALRYEMDGEIQPMSGLSPVRRAIVEDPIPTKKSEAPDWISTPSLVEIFPALNTALQRIKIAIAKLRSRSVTDSGTASLISQTVAQIDALIEETQGLLAELNDIINKASTLLTQDIAGLHSTTFSVSEGGTSAWSAELSKRLSDPDDNTKPPYTEGDEFVTGLIIVAGAPNPPALEGIKNLLSLLFGGSGGNSLLDAVDSIEKEVRKEEKIVFGEDLSSERKDRLTKETKDKGFDESLTPTTDPVC